MRSDLLLEHTIFIKTNCKKTSLVKIGWKIAVNRGVDALKLGFYCKT